MNDLERLQRLAKVLDSNFRIGGIKFGWDSIIGLIPVLGDFATGILALSFVVYAYRMGLPKPILGRMLLNVLIDVIIGGLPILGDLFDFVWKANIRNLRLIEKHYSKN